MICLNYQDTIVLADTLPDEYGTEQISDQTSVGALIVVNSGYSHGANQDAVTTNTVVFVDPSNQFVIDNSYRLEEFLINMPIYGTAIEDAWYKVVNVDVNRDILLCNQIDTISLTLKKTVGSPS